MEFWSLNPYVGCEFGCTYCYARFAHRYVVERASSQGTLAPAELREMASAIWEAFERRIFVKRRDTVLDALDRDLERLLGRGASPKHETLLIGTATDPYQPAEREFRITRAVLERLAEERGLSIGIITKSPMVCRDVDLFGKLQQRHRLAIHISLITIDPDLIRCFEARSPMPHVRLRALSRLTAANVNAGLIVAPILPGISDSVTQFTELIQAAKAAGARFAHPSPLRLYAGIRKEFIAHLEREFPQLVRRYRLAYRGFGTAPAKYADAVRLRFKRVAARFDIPVHYETSDALDAWSDETEAHQLSLWEPRPPKEQHPPPDPRPQPDRPGAR